MKQPGLFPAGVLRFKVYPRLYSIHSNHQGGFLMNETENTENDIADVDSYDFTTPEFKPTAPRQCERFRDADGHLCVKNLSAYWIPELTITEVIGGTVYTVDGTYEGTEMFVRKLERITGRMSAEKMEAQP